MELTRLTINEASKKLKNRQISVKELVQSYLQRIEKLNKTMGAFITICEEEAINQSEYIQKKMDEDGKISPVAGIPVALNDNIITKGVLTTCASKMLYNFIPPYDSTVNEKLRENHTVLLGKLNMDEFGAGNSNENSYFGSVKNPWDLDRVAGGYSGGAAAAVAAGMTCFSIGSDTSGSIRQPSAFCGVVGLKPTYGVVSRYGLVASASSMDQIGPVTLNVEDCATVMNLITGHDPKDSISIDTKLPDYTSFLKEDIKGLKIGIPKEYIEKGVQEDVKQKIIEAAKTLESLGANVTEISLPLTEYAIPAFYLIASAESSSNLARYDGIEFGYRAKQFDDLIDLYRKTRSEGFGTEVKRRIILGTYALSSEHYDEYYKKALKVRRLIVEEFGRAFSDVDLIIGPTVPETAFKIGEKISDPLKMYLGDIYTVSANIAGLCAMSIPCGTDSRGLPVGMQLIGKPFDEGVLLKAAYSYEKNTQHVKVPEL